MNLTLDYLADQFVFWNLRKILLRHRYKFFEQKFFTGEKPTNNDKFDEEGKLRNPLNLSDFQSNSESIVEQFKIKPEYEKALTELSERNVEEFY